MKYFTYLIVLLWGTVATAQSNFIEIHVADTLWVKTESFDYQVTINTDAYDPDYGYATDSAVYDYDKAEKQQQEARQKRIKEQLAALQKLLTKNGFAPKDLQSTPSAAIGQGYAEPKGYVVTIKKAADARRLQDVLSPLDYVQAAATNFKYADFNLLEERLMKKAMAHASQKAAVLATASGQKLGKVLEITEADMYTTYTFDSYVEDSYDGEARKKMMRVLPKTLTVKFALE
jgi:hypothetical protein